MIALFKRRNTHIVNIHIYVCVCVCERERERETHKTEVDYPSHRQSKIKVKPSHYRPEVPRGFQEVKVPRLRDNGPGWW